MIQVAPNLTTSARYEFEPFGQQIRASGLLAKQNPFRYSTRYCDQETGLIAYATRYHNPIFGRWLNRDSINERGGLNLLAFVNNNPMMHSDPIGRATLSDTVASVGIIGGLAAAGGANLNAIVEQAEEVTAYVPELEQAELEAGGVIDHLVLGMRQGGTRTLANDIGGSHLFDNTNWKEMFQMAIKNPDMKISINLNRMDGFDATDKLLNAIANGQGYTDWEIGQLFESGQLGSATLYENSVQVANEFSGLQW